ncbi:MAG TPA: Rieske 2Fe-2S domain-containing protein [Dehalococcoidia bacterium]|nr:Rieske 2Fe-2S domain-containing protein [Dehalococcoidia bacterium]
MLPKEENELLTRVGPGTPMGRMMREYWAPALLSEELSDVDGRPVRVRLLCEDLIAFRDSAGRAGLLANNCPHRGASLFFGRNEDDGLRCVYHGWKFDVTGACVDMPNEPPESNFKDKVRATAYPCVERNGVIWTYMGPRSTPPPLPELEWNLDTVHPPYMWMNYRECNWLQAIEGGIDTSHVNFLHRRLDNGRTTAVGVEPVVRDNDLVLYGRRDSCPALEVIDTEFGVLYTGRRSVDDTTDYHRIHPFIFPFHNMIGGGTQADEVAYTGMVWTPVDDENTLVLEYHYRPARGWAAEELERTMRVRNPTGFLPMTTQPGSRWRFRANKTNDYLVDYDLQRSKLFFGVQGNPAQDGAIQESMGTIFDRSSEHLGTADAMIIRVRRRLLEVLRAYEDGATPPGVDNPQMYAIRPVGALLPKGADWVKETEQRRRAALVSAPTS